MPEVHPEVFYPEVFYPEVPEGLEGTEGLEGAQAMRFWARLEGPAAWLSRSIAILVACAFEIFCGCRPVPEVFTLKGSKGRIESVSGRVSKARQLGFREALRFWWLVPSRRFVTLNHLRSQNPQAPRDVL